MVGETLRQRKRTGAAIKTRGGIDVPASIGQRASVQQKPWYVSDYGAKTWDLVTKQTGTMFDKIIKEELKSKSDEDANTLQAEENARAKSEERNPKQIKANPFLKFFNPNIASAFNKTTQFLFEENLNTGIYEESIRLQNEIRSDDNIPVEQKGSAYSEAFNKMLDERTSEADISTLGSIVNKFTPHRSKIENAFMTDAIKIKRKQQFNDQERIVDSAIDNLVTTARANGDIASLSDELVRIGTNLKEMNPTDDKEAEFLTGQAEKINTALKTGALLKTYSGLSIEEKREFSIDIANGKEKKYGIDIVSTEERKKIVNILKEILREDQEFNKIESMHFRDELRDSKDVIKGDGRVNIEGLYEKAARLDSTGDKGFVQDVDDLVVLQGVRYDIEERSRMSSDELAEVISQDRRLARDREFDTPEDIMLMEESIELLDELRTADRDFDTLSLAAERLNFDLEPAQNGVFKDIDERMSRVNQARARYGEDKVLIYTKDEMDQMRKTFANLKSGADKSKFMNDLMQPFRSLGAAKMLDELAPIFRYLTKQDPNFAYLANTQAESSNRSIEILQQIYDGMDLDSND